ncbi:uncharacterized protein [Elaeis guineensis]|uniref:Uncharacterized protein LOC105035834 n=1 Tax=Elaeis guineensis var. tenera TaxID=51953 RepID=A0A6I9QI00_ELAGV|nr:uncharacterized protein LOC105035834 [Elaeis guineensis]
MELSRERSFTEYMQSKLLDCEQARAGLENELSALEERWQPKGLHMEHREAEVRVINEALKECIQEQHDVGYACDMLENEMKRLEHRCADLEMYNKDSEEQIKEYTATIEQIQKDNEKIGLSLCHAEEKIKELCEMNSSMLFKLSGREYHQGAGSMHSASSSAHGK